MKNPVSGQFTGSDAWFSKVIALSFDHVPALRGFLASRRAELEILAKEWHETRNVEGHEPGLILRSPVDLGSVNKIVGSGAAQAYAVKALDVGADIVQRLNLFPTSALT